MLIDAQWKEISESEWAFMVNDVFIATVYRYYENGIIGGWIACVGHGIRAFQECFRGHLSPTAGKDWVEWHLRQRKIV